MLQSRKSHSGLGYQVISDTSYQHPEHSSITDHSTTFSMEWFCYHHKTLFMPHTGLQCITCLYEVITFPYTSLHTYIKSILTDFSVAFTISFLKTLVFSLTWQCINMWANQFCSWLPSLLVWCKCDTDLSCLDLPGSSSGTQAS